MPRQYPTEVLLWFQAIIAIADDCERLAVIRVLMTQCATDLLRAPPHG